MAAPTSTNSDQIDLWNGSRGQAWVARADQYDAQLEIYALKAVAGLAPQPGDRVIDIGCGAGATAFEAANAVGGAGSVTGLDLSEPMIDLARARAEAKGFANVDFVIADAQTAAPPEHPVDGIVSRFGVMFFDDPGTAFANIARMVRSGGRMAFVAWATAHDNDWITEPMKAVADIVPPLTPADPNAPGPFAFADVDRVVDLLEANGWTEVEFEEVVDSVYIGGKGSVDAAVEFVIGGSGLALPLAEKGPEAVDQARAALTRLFGSQHDGLGVRYPALADLVLAHRAV